MAAASEGGDLYNVYRGGEKGDPGGIKGDGSEEENNDGGRGDDEPVTKWTGMTAKQLKEECKKHDIPVGGNKVALLEQLSQFKEMKSRIARETIPMRDLSEQDLVALQ